MSHNASSPSEKTQFKPQSKRLMDQVREVLRYHHYAIRTEVAYVKWILSPITCRFKKHEIKRSVTNDCQLSAETLIL